MKIYIYILSFILVGAAHTIKAADEKAGTVPAGPGQASIEKPAADARIGSVKTVAGDIAIVRNNKIFTAKVGTTLFVNDTLTTGRDGAVGVIFKDNGVLSIGPNSKVVIRDFAFIPDQQNFSMITDILKGSCVYLGGVIAKLKPISVLFKTPSATIGIRGTRFAVKVGGP